MVVLQILIALLCLSWFIYRRRVVGIFEIYLILYTFFYCGPYLANKLRIPIFRGIDPRYIDTSMTIFLASLITLIIGASMPLGIVAKFDIRPSQRSKKISKLIFLYPASIVLISIISLSFLRGVAFSGLDKVSIITIMGWTHYPVLTLIPCILLVHMVNSSENRRHEITFWISVALFTFYATITNERDFILLAIPIYFWAKGTTSIKVRDAALISIPTLIAFSMLSVGRSSTFDGGIIASTLNQGSNLMVMTQTVSFLENGGDHIMGISYLSAVINAFSLGQYRIWGPGSVWLSNYYSNGAAAYGFSIEAEAYLNFGIIGVVAVFFAISRYYLALEHLVKSGSKFGMLLMLHFSFFVMYGIRGEFLTILKSNFSHNHF